MGQKKKLLCINLVRCLVAYCSAKQSSLKNLLGKPRAKIAKSYTNQTTLRIKKSGLNPKFLYLCLSLQRMPKTQQKIKKVSRKKKRNNQLGRKAEKAQLVIFKC